MLIMINMIMHIGKLKYIVVYISGQNAPAVIHSC